MLNDAEVYVFGSIVRGNYNPMSDVDVMIVSEKIPDNIIEQAKIKGIEKERRINYVLKRLQLESLAKRRLLNLSGGQTKRVEVAKILVQRPSIAFFDEPTAMVDLDGKHIIWEEIKKLRDEG